MSNIYTFYVSPSTALIPLFIGVRYLKKQSVSYKFLLAFLMLSITSTILMRVFAYIYHNNVNIVKLYTIGEFPLLAGFYYRQFNSARMRQVIAACVVMFAAISISLFIISFKDVQFDNYSASIEALFIIFFGVSFVFNSTGQTLYRKDWSYYPANWFNTGILLYFSGSLFIFLLTNYILPYNYEIYRLVWKIHATLFLFLSLLFSIGFLKNRDTVK
jgi:hypothetical protein